MKRTLIILSFILAQATLKAQTIKGTILEAGTDKKLSNVTVYFDGTSNVTSSDSEGNFTLNIRGNNKVPLVTSLLGYENETTTDYLSGKKMIIYLQPRQIDLEAVEITASDGVPRNIKLARFQTQFLGLFNVRDCEILNRDDIRLSMNKTNGTLTAYCDKPIIVHNRKLGYTFYFSLEKFVSTLNETSFYGPLYFEEDKRISNSIEKARENAYLGSRMHFIKSLWNNDLKKNDFKIFRKTENDINYDSIVVSSNGQKYFRPKEKLIILYKDKVQSFVFTDPAKDIYIDKDGYNDPIGITWGGYIGGQRAADMLPLEYNSATELRNRLLIR